MDYAKLRALLATEEYAAIADPADAAALANEQRHSVAAPTQWTYLGLASSMGIGIEAAGRLIATIDVVAESNPVVAEMRNFLRDPNGGISPAEVGTQAMLDTFAANEALPLTEADATAIKALGSKLRSDAEQLGLGAVSVPHIIRARMD